MPQSLPGMMPPRSKSFVTAVEIARPLQSIPLKLFAFTPRFPLQPLTALKTQPFASLSCTLVLSSIPLVLRHTHYDFVLY